MKTPALRPRTGDPSLRHKAIVFYGSRSYGLGWWCVALLLFAIVAGNHGLSDQGVMWGLAGLMTSLACLLCYRPGRLDLIEDGLCIDRPLRRRRWVSWSEIRQIQLDHAARFGRRPTVNFRVKGEGRVFLWGPWNVDATTVYTAMVLAQRWWGDTASEPKAASATEPQALCP